MGVEVFKDWRWGGFGGLEGWMRGGKVGVEGEEDMKAFSWDECKVGRSAWGDLVSAGGQMVGRRGGLGVGGYSALLNCRRVESLVIGTTGQ